MKKPIVAIAAVVIVALLGGLLIALSGSSTNTSQETVIDDNAMKMGKTPSKTDTSSNQSTSTPAATSSVTIKEFAFSPATITVKVGTKVTWTNQDSVGHTVTDDGTNSGLDSKVLNKGESYSFTFTKAGTFKYLCTPHPYMKGTVTVTE